MLVTIDIMLFRQLNWSPIIIKDVMRGHSQSYYTRDIQDQKCRLPSNLLGNFVTKTSYKKKGNFVIDRLETYDKKNGRLAII